MLDYRGYGKSSGRIESEAQLHADVRAAWAASRRATPGRRVVFFGRSLGTALAATLAAEVQPDLTVLVSPYDSMAALARQHYPWVPARAAALPAAHRRGAGAHPQAPVLLVHGDRDTLIPLAHSERAAGDRARMRGCTWCLAAGTTTCRRSRATSARCARRWRRCDAVEAAAAAGRAA